MNKFQRLTNNLKLPICEVERTMAYKNNTGRKENPQKNTGKTDQNINKVVSVDFCLSILAFLYLKKSLCLI